MSNRTWKRLAELRARLRARDEAYDKAAAAVTEPRTSAGERRYHAYRRRDSRHLIGVAFAARLLRIPVHDLVGALRGEPFFLDFGLDRYGEPLRFFRSAELARYAARRLRGKEGRPAARIVQRPLAA